MSDPASNYKKLGLVHIQGLCHYLERESFTNFVSIGEGAYS